MKYINSATICRLLFVVVTTGSLSASLSPKLTPDHKSKPDSSQRSNRPDKPSANSVAVPVINKNGQFDTLTVSGDAKISGDLIVCGRIPKVETCLESLQSCCEQNSRDISILDICCAQSISCCENLSSRVAFLETCCDNVTSIIDNFGTRLDHLESCCEQNTACCSALEIEINKLISEVDNHETRIERLESCCEQNTTAIDNLVSCCDNHETRIEALESCCEEVNSRLDLLERLDCCPNCFCVDFGQFKAGDTVNIINSKLSPAITFSSVATDTVYGGPLIIFNSSNPSCDQTCLGSPNNDFGGPGVGVGGGEFISSSTYILNPAANSQNLGNVLVISDTRCNPKASSKGGIITVTFQCPVIFCQAGFLNICSGDSCSNMSSTCNNYVELLDSTGAIINTYILNNYGANSYQVITPNQNGVSKLVISFSGATALTSLCFRCEVIDLAARSCCDLVSSIVDFQKTQIDNIISELEVLESCCEQNTACCSVVESEINNLTSVVENFGTRIDNLQSCCEQNIACCSAVEIAINTIISEIDNHETRIEQLESCCEFLTSIVDNLKKQQCCPQEYCVDFSTFTPGEQQDAINAEIASQGAQFTVTGVANSCESGYCGPIIGTDPDASTNPQLFLSDGSDVPAPNPSGGTITITFACSVIIDELDVTSSSTLGCISYCGINPVGMEACFVPPIKAIGGTGVCPNVLEGTNTYASTQSGMPGSQAVVVNKVIISYPAGTTISIGKICYHCVPSFVPGGGALPESTQDVSAFFAACCKSLCVNFSSLGTTSLIQPQINAMLAGFTITALPPAIVVALPEPTLSPNLVIFTNGGDGSLPQPVTPSIDGGTFFIDFQCPEILNTVDIGNLILTNTAMGIIATTTLTAFDQNGNPLQTIVLPGLHSVETATFNQPNVSKLQIDVSNQSGLVGFCVTCPTIDDVARSCCDYLSSIVDDFGTRIENLESCCEQNTVCCSVVESEVNNLTSIVENFGTRIDNLQSCCEQNIACCSAVEMAINTIISELESLESCCEGNSTQIENLTSIVDNFGTRIEALESCCEEVNSRLDLLECPQCCPKSFCVNFTKFSTNPPTPVDVVNANIGFCGNVVFESSSNRSIQYEVVDIMTAYGIAGTVTSACLSNPTANILHADPSSDDIIISFPVCPVVLETMGFVADEGTPIQITTYDANGVQLSQTPIITFAYSGELDVVINQTGVSSVQITSFEGDTFGLLCFCFHCEVIDLAARSCCDLVTSIVDFQQTQIDNIISELEALESCCEGNTTQIENITSIIDNFGTRIENLESCCEQNTACCSVVESEINNLTSIVDNFGTRIDNLQSCCDQNVACCSVVELVVNNLTSIVDNFGTRIENLESCCEQNTACCSAVENAINTIVSELESLESCCEGNSTQIENLTSIVDNFGTRIDNLESCCEQNTACCSAVESEINNLTSIVDDFGTRIENLESCCEQNTACCSAVEIAINTIISELESLESCCEGNSTQIENLISIIENHETRIEALESCCEEVNSRLDLLECPQCCPKEFCVNFNQFSNNPPTPGAVVNANIGYCGNVVFEGTVTRKLGFAVVDIMEHFDISGSVTSICLTSPTSNALLSGVNGSTPYLGISFPICPVVLDNMGLVANSSPENPTNLQITTYDVNGNQLSQTTISFSSPGEQDVVFNQNGVSSVQIVVLPNPDMTPNSFGLVCFCFHCETIDLVARSCCDQLSSLVEFQQTQIENLTSIVDDFGTRIENLESCCEQNIACCSAVEMAVNNIISQVENLESCCEGNSTQIENLTSIVDNFGTRIENLESCCEQNTACCSVVESEINNLTSIVDDFGTRIENLESCCEQNTVCCSAVEIAINNIISEIDNHETRIEQLESCCEFLTSVIDTIRKQQCCPQEYCVDFSTFTPGEQQDAINAEIASQGAQFTVTGVANSCESGYCGPIIGTDPDASTNPQLFLSDGSDVPAPNPNGGTITITFACSVIVDELDVTSSSTLGCISYCGINPVGMEACFVPPIKAVGGTGVCPNVLEGTNKYASTQSGMSGSQTVVINKIIITYPAGTTLSIGKICYHCATSYIPGGGALPESTQDVSAFFAACCKSLCVNFSSLGTASLIQPQINAMLPGFTITALPPAVVVALPEPTLSPNLVIFTNGGDGSLPQPLTPSIDGGTFFIDFQCPEILNTVDIGNLILTNTAMGILATTTLTAFDQDGNPLQTIILPGLQSVETATFNQPNVSKLQIDVSNQSGLVGYCVTCPTIDDVARSCCDYLSSIVDNFGTRIDNLESCCEQNSSNITTLFSLIDLVQSCTTCFISGLDNLVSCCEGNSTQIENLTSIVDDFGTRIESLESCCEQNQTCCSILETEISSVFDIIIRIKSDLGGHESRLDALESCCELNTTCCSVVESEVNNLTSVVNTFATSMENLESCCEGNSTQIENLTSIVDEFGTRIENLESCCEQNTACCSAVEIAINNLISDVESLQSQIDACCENQCLQCYNFNGITYPSSTSQIFTRQGSLGSCCPPIDSPTSFGGNELRNTGGNADSANNNYPNVYSCNACDKYICIQPPYPQYLIKVKTNGNCDNASCISVKTFVSINSLPCALTAESCLPTLRDTLMRALNPFGPGAGNAPDLVNFSLYIWNNTTSTWDVAVITDVPNHHICTTTIPPVPPFDPVFAYVGPNVCDYVDSDGYVSFFATTTNTGCELDLNCFQMCISCLPCPPAETEPYAHSCCEELTSLIENHETRIENLESCCEGNSTQIENLTSIVDDFGTRIENLESCCEQNTACCSVVESEVNNLTSIVDILQNQVSILELCCQNQCIKCYDFYGLTSTDANSNTSQIFTKIGGSSNTPPADPTNSTFNGQELSIYNNTGSMMGMNDYTSLWTCLSMTATQYVCTQPPYPEFLVRVKTDGNCQNASCLSVQLNVSMNSLPCANRTPQDLVRAVIPRNSCPNYSDVVNLTIYIWNFAQGQWQVMFDQDVPDHHICDFGGTPPTVPFDPVVAYVGPNVCDYVDSDGFVAFFLTTANPCPELDINCFRVCLSCLPCPPAETEPYAHSCCEELTSLIENHETRIENLESCCEQNSSNITTLFSLIDLVQSCTTCFISGLDNLVSCCEGNSTQIENITSIVDDFGTRIENLESCCEQNTACCSVLELQVNSLISDVESLQSQIEACCQNQCIQCYDFNGITYPSSTSQIFTKNRNEPLPQYPVNPGTGGFNGNELSPFNDDGSMIGGNNYPSIYNCNVYDKYICIQPNYPQFLIRFKTEKDCSDVSCISLKSYVSLNSLPCSPGRSIIPSQSLIDGYSTSDTANLMVYAYNFTTATWTLITNTFLTNYHTCFPNVPPTDLVFSYVGPDACDYIDANGYVAFIFTTSSTVCELDISCLQLCLSCLPCPVELEPYAHSCCEELTSLIENHETRIENLESCCEGNSTQIENLTSILDGFGTSIDNLESCCEQNSAAISILDACCAANATCCANLASRIEKLECPSCCPQFCIDFSNFAQGQTQDDINNKYNRCGINISTCINPDSGCTGVVVDSSALGVNGPLNCGCLTQPTSNVFAAVFDGSPVIQDFYITFTCPVTLDSIGLVGSSSNATISLFDINGNMLPSPYPSNTPFDQCQEFPFNQSGVASITITITSDTNAGALACLCFHCETVDIIARSLIEQLTTVVDSQQTQIDELQTCCEQNSNAISILDLCCEQNSSIIASQAVYINNLESCCEQNSNAISILEVCCSTVESLIGGYGEIVFNALQMGAMVSGADSITPSALSIPGFNIGTSSVLLYGWSIMPSTSPAPVAPCMTFEVPYDIDTTQTIQVDAHFLVKDPTITTTASVYTARIQLHTAFAGNNGLIGPNYGIVLTSTDVTVVNPGNPFNQLRQFKVTFDLVNTSTIIAAQDWGALVFNRVAPSIPANEYNAPIYLSAVSFRYRRLNNL